MIVITVARKPTLTTVAANALEYGTGGLNIDGCRVGYQSEEDKAANLYRPGRGQGSGNHQASLPSQSPDWGGWVGGQGRWPANLVLTEGLLDDVPTTQTGLRLTEQAPVTKTKGVTGWGTGSNTDRWYLDKGGASRFFKVIPK